MTLPRPSSALPSLLADADVTVGNLECTFAGPEQTDLDGWAPDNLAGTLSGLGFDLLQTANSCSIAGGLDGLKRTMETVTAAQMQYAGTSPDKKSHKKDYGIAEFETGGMRIVFVAFTKGLGNLRLPDGAEYAVNLLYEDYDTNYTQVATTQIEAVMAAARKRSPDVLIALVHWGAEDDSQHSQTQERIADLLVANGADVILGSHSHQPGPIETRTATDENGDEHTALVAYDLGDFYTASDKSARQGIVLQLEFTKDKRGSVQLTKQDYTPLYRTTDAAGKPPVPGLGRGAGQKALRAGLCRPNLRSGLRAVGSDGRRYPGERGTQREKRITEHQRTPGIFSRSALVYLIIPKARCALL